jgi:hypothetical protein
MPGIGSTTYTPLYTRQLDEHGFMP